MIFQEWRDSAEAVGIMQHRHVVVHSLRDPWVCHVRSLLFAEVGDCHRKLVVLRKVAECGVVVGMADVKDDKGAGFPLLHGKQLRLNWSGWRRSRDVVLLE